jgi:predicted DNA-binding WGR domain protein
MNPSNPRRFEFQEGGSSKFWEVSQEGASFTVRYGRIGAAGTSKTTTLDSPEAAAAEVEKLIREKTRKGYQEQGAAPNWRPPAHHGTTEHVTRWYSRLVTGFNPEADGEEEDEGRKSLPALRECERRAFFVGVSYDDPDGAFDARLDALLADPRLSELKSLLIGPWSGDELGEEPVEVWQKLAAAGPRLTALEDVFLGEVVQEESEISWLMTGDVGPVLSAMPALRHAIVRGHGEALRLSGLRSETLEHLTIQSGGLSQAVIDDLAAAHLPNLTELCLWLGTSYYGYDVDLAKLAALLPRFPKLVHLGLQNAENQDAVIDVALASPVLAQLRSLDLSMGTTSDAGARALLASPGVKALGHLNLRYHYIQDRDLLKALRALGPEVDLRDAQEGDEDDRYPEVTE